LLQLESVLPGSTLLIGRDCLQNNNKLKGTVATELSGSKQKAAKQKTSKKGFGLGRLCCCSQSTVLH